MIFLDQRGCGRSNNAPNKDYFLQHIAQDFEEVRHALGIPGTDGPKRLQFPNQQLKYMGGGHTFYMCMGLNCTRL